MIQATMAVYKAAVSNFLPTPSKSHYVFNLRDFARVVRGVLLVPKTHLGEGDKLIRLWVHEVYRVFYDRLIDDKDREQFFAIVKDTLQETFKVGADKLLQHLTTSGSLTDDDIRYTDPVMPCTSTTLDIYSLSIRGLFFGDYMLPSADPRIYDEVTDFQALTSVMEK